MIINVFKEEVIGYKNKIKNIGSQDYIKYEFIDNGIIAAIADGHSTKHFTYSDIGARFACEVAIEVLKLYKDKEDLEDFAKSLEIQKFIYNIWNEKVEKHYKSIYPIVFKTEYLRYSTTLIATLITDTHRLYLKIGDGDIVYKDFAGCREIFERRVKPRYVDSLGRPNMYRKMYYKYEKVTEHAKNDCVILYSDGFENSFNNKVEMYRQINNTISNFISNVFSRYKLTTEYKSYLSFLSEKNSKDDISIILLQLN